MGAIKKTAIVQLVESSSPAHGTTVDASTNLAENPHSLNNQRAVSRTQEQQKCSPYQKPTSLTRGTIIGKHGIPVSSKIIPLETLKEHTYVSLIADTAVPSLYSPKDESPTLFLALNRGDTIIIPAGTTVRFNKGRDVLTLVAPYSSGREYCDLPKAPKGYSIVFGDKLTSGQRTISFSQCPGSVPLGSSFKVLSNQLSSPQSNSFTETVFLDQHRTGALIARKP